MSAALELNGFDDLQSLIDKLPALALDAAEVAMGQTLLFLHGKIPPYPGPVSFAPGIVAATWTPKQRRFFFAMLAKGRIKLPYRRTGKLGQSFTEKVTRSADDVVGEIGTNDLKAPWVVGPKYPGREIRGQAMYQARIHAGRWWEFEEVMAEAGPEGYGVFEDAFRAEFLRLIDEVPHATS